MHTEPTRQTDSPSLDAELPLTDSETESDEEVPVINVGDQDEGQVGPNPSEQDKGQAGPNPGEQDDDQAGSNPGYAAESQPQPSHVVHSGPNLEHMDLETTYASTKKTRSKWMKIPASSTRTLSSLQNLDKGLSFTDQFFVEKTQEEEPGKTNAEAEVQSMVSVPIHQDTSSAPPMTTLVIDLTKSQSDSPLPTSTATTSTITKTTTLPPPPLQSTTDPILVRHIGELEQHIADLIQNNLALEERLDKQGSRLYKWENLNIPHQMFEDNTYKTHEVHSDLFEALQNHLYHLLQQAHLVLQVLLEHQDPLSCPHILLFYLLVYLDQHNNKDDSIPEEQVHLSDDEDSENDQQPKANSRKEWWKPLPEDFEGQAYEVVKTNPKGDHVRIDVNRPLPLGRPPGHVTIQPQFFFNTYLEYLRYGSKGSNPALLMSKMKAASYPDFGLELLVPKQIWIDDCHKNQSILKIWYDYLSEIVLRRADFQEYTIAEKDFKNLYPSDFEDLNLLLLQGHFDHLPGSDKRMLSTAVKQWTRNLVIRQWVEEFQLGIESYQTKLNLTKPGWDATGYEFKHNYTIIESPRAVLFPVDNNDRKIMRFNEIYKFSDGTLIRILEALDYRVKEFKVKQLNPGINMRFWTQKDMTRSKEFIAAIERRLKTRRIFWNLECFVGGRVRDIDYRLLQRTE
ncbi:hypothetical protein Tco_0487130 [Tanacetum coccineum]